jgi:hypothetical protein
MPEDDFSPEDQVLNRRGEEMRDAATLAADGKIEENGLRCRRRARRGGSSVPIP